MDTRRRVRSSLVSLAVVFASVLAACGQSSSGAGGDAGEDSGALDASQPDTSGEDVTVDSQLGSDAADSAIAQDAGRDAVADATRDTGASSPDGSSPAEAGADSSSGLDASGDTGSPAVDSGPDSGFDAGALPDTGADSAGAPCTSSGQCVGGNVCVSGQCGPAVLLFAGSSTSLLGGTFQPAAAWSTSALSDATSMGTSLTMDSTGRAVGAYTSSTGSVVSSVVWSNGTWGAPAAITASAVARSQPFVDATGGTTSHLAYQDATYHYWYLAYTGTWSAPQTIGVTGNQYYGPFAATIAARGSNAAAAFFDGTAGADVNDMAASDLSVGSWQAKVDVVGNTIGGSNQYVIPVAMAALSAGPELLAIYVDSSSVIQCVTRTSGAWSAPAAIPNALTNDPVGLAPLPNGGAILAFRGQDTNLYWSVYSSGAWAGVAPFASPNVSVAKPPAVIHGMAGDVAELAFIEGDGQAYHARLQGSAWSAPVLVGGASLIGVAIAAAP